VPLFAVPVSNTQLNTASEEIKQFLINVEFERMFSGNGWYSVDKYILDRPEVAPLKNNIMDALRDYVDVVLELTPEVSFEMKNSWVVKHDVGDWGQMHAHTNCLLSGVYYLDVSEKSGDLIFHKSTGWDNLFPLALDIDVKTQNTFNSKMWRFRPHNDQLFLFPSNALHSISVNDSESTRYSLAFNFFPKGKLGGKEYELVL
jgi:uncharacterized protein (TIGR02466 family)